MSTAKMIETLWPFVTRKAHTAKVASVEHEAQRARQAQAELHARDMAEERKRVAAHVDRLSRVEWDRRDGLYRVTVTINEVQFYRAAESDLDRMAEHVAWRVRCDITNGKFVESAWMREREERSRYRIPGYEPAAPPAKGDGAK